MNKKIAIISSSKDPASKNIRNSVLDKLELDQKTSNHLNNPYYENKDFLLHEIDKKQLNSNEIDTRLSKIINPCLVVFPSKHSSENEQNNLCVHAPGNPGKEARYGGKSNSLSMSAPSAMKKALKSINQRVKESGLEYRPTLECTHHGPSEIDVPCFFIEIGNSLKNWRDKAAGEVLAESIIDLKNLDGRGTSCISLGGGHYSPRQTNLVIETGIEIGHIIPDYHLGKISIIREGIEKTPQCKFIHLSGDKTKNPQLTKRLDEINLPRVREKKIRALDPVPFEKWKEIEEIEKNAQPFYFGKKTKKLSLETINKEFIEYLQKINRKKFVESIRKHELVCYKYINGEISNRFLFPLKNIKQNKLGFIQDCVEIVKEKRDVEYFKEENKFSIEIREKRFDPGKAKRLGLRESQFSKLTSGQKVKVGANTITPAMVHNINKKKLEVNYLPIKKRVVKIFD